MVGLDAVGEGQGLSKMQGHQAGQEMLRRLKSRGVEGNEPSPALSFPLLFLLCIINYHPVLFSFYSLFQVIAGDLLSALGQWC